MVRHRVGHRDAFVAQGRRQQVEEERDGLLLGHAGVAGAELRDTNGEAPLLREAEDGAEQLGVHTRAAQVVQQRRNLQVGEAPAIEAHGLGDPQHDARRPLGVLLVVAGDDPARVSRIGHVVHRQQGVPGRLVHGVGV